MVLDALPVTAVGKLYKLALRADADPPGTEPCPRRGSPECPRSHTAVEDGSVVATVDGRSPADQAAVKAILDRYAVAWRSVVQP